MGSAVEDTTQQIARVRVRDSIGSLHIDVDLCLTRRWTILFGPSGSGKTTILRAIAGLSHPDEAEIAIRSTSLTDSNTGKFVPPHRRNIGFVAQQSALFPHLSVRENIAYGIPADASRSSRDEAVLNSLQRFRVEAISEAMPGSLSGGEQRRVAVARAVTAALCRPNRSMILLDEPFAGLDLPLRDLLIAELQAIARDVPILSVTHDVAESFSLGAEVIRIANGRVVAQGPAEHVLSEERERLLKQLHA